MWFGNLYHENSVIANSHNNDANNLDDDNSIKIGYSTFWIWKHLYLKNNDDNDLNH